MQILMTDLSPSLLCEIKPVFSFVGRETMSGIATAWRRRV